MAEDTEDKVTVYAGMNQAALDAAYNNSAAVADSAAFLEDWRQRSARTRQNLDSVIDIPYGHNDRNRLDLFLSGADAAPLFVFIHGGYWQKNDKSMFSFIADGLCQQGVDVAVPGYSLAPSVSLSDIAAEIRQALAFIHSHPQQFQQDRNRIIVGGWSAGGHLTALTQAYPAVTGVVPISGIFDLEPIAHSYLNDKLQLSAEEIHRLSPIRHWPSRTVPIRMAVGSLELPELIRQSEEYAESARDQGRDASLTQLPGRHHFSILEELAEPDGALTRMVLNLC